MTGNRLLPVPLTELKLAELVGWVGLLVNLLDLICWSELVGAI